MASYQEKLASDACFSLNFEIKTNAERLLHEWIAGLNSESILLAYQSGSPTLILALSAVLKMKMNSRTDKVAIFKVLLCLMQAWHTSQLTFIRDGKQLDFYIVNTVLTLTETTFKHCFNQISQRALLLQLIIGLSDSKLQLRIWKSILEGSTQQDLDATLLRYKSFLVAFQQTILPLIFERLLPHFFTAEDEAKVVELVEMQEGLSLNVQEAILNTKCAPWPQKTANKDYCSLVCQVLRSVTNFGYDQIAEDMQETPILKINRFPEQILAVIVRSKFMEALYFITERLVAAKKVQVQVCIDCILKILSANFNYIQRPTRIAFQSLNMKGLTRLLNASVPQRILEGILKAAKCFVQIEQFMLIQHQNSIQAQFLHAAFQVSTKIMLGMKPDSKVLATESLQLIRAIVKSWQIKGSKSRNNAILQLLTNWINAYIPHLLSRNTPIYGESLLLKVSEALSQSETFLSMIRSIAHKHQLQLLRLIKQSLAISINEMHFGGILNGFLLIQVLCSKKNQQDDRNTTKEYEEASQLLKSIVIAYYDYASTRPHQDKAPSFISWGIVNFMCKICAKCLKSSQQVNNQIHSYCPIFRMLRSDQSQVDAYLIDNAMVCIRELYYTDLLGIEFTLECLNNLMTNIETSHYWAMFRESKGCLQIVNQLFVLLSRTTSNDAYASRTKIASLLVRISLNHDRPNWATLDRLIQLILSLAMQGRIYDIIYDLTGIAFGITNLENYTQFIAKLHYTINLPKLIDVVFQTVNSDYKLEKTALKMCQQLLRNKKPMPKGHRFNKWLYHLAGAMIPHWIGSLQKCTHEKSSGLFMCLTRCLKELLIGNRINCFLLDKQNINWSSMLAAMLARFCSFSGWFFQIKELKYLFRQIMAALCKIHYEFITSTKNKSLIASFCGVMGHFVERIIKETEDNKLCDKQDSKYLLKEYCGLLAQFYQLIGGSFKLTHKKDCLANIYQINASLKEAIVRLLAAWILFSITNSQSYRLYQVLFQTCKAIHIVGRVNIGGLESACVKLGLTQTQQATICHIVNQSESSGDEKIASLRLVWQQCSYMFPALK